MKNPKITTKVVHSESKPAYNIVGTRLGDKFKIARVPYLVTDDALLNAKEKKEAFDLAEYISWCFNNSDIIISNFSLS